MLIIVYHRVQRILLFYLEDCVRCCNIKILLCSKMNYIFMSNIFIDVIGRMFKVSKEFKVQKSRNIKRTPDYSRTQVFRE